MVRAEGTKLIIELEGQPEETLNSLTDSLLNLFASADLNELDTGALYFVCRFLRDISLDPYQIEKGLIEGEQHRKKVDSGEYMKMAIAKEKLLNENPEIAYQMV